jgi:MraZ protein
MAGQPFIYSGQGFSLLRDKNRFVLPNVLRSTVRESSGSRDVLFLAKHPEWKCLVGFGQSRVDEFEAQLDAEQARADAAGRAFNRDRRAMQLYNFQQVPFDGSGRFTMPEALTSLAALDDQLFFQGIGRTILIWNPEELYKLADDPEFEAAIATCRSLQDAEQAKAKKK